MPQHRSILETHLIPSFESDRKASSLRTPVFRPPLAFAAGRVSQSAALRDGMKVWPLNHLHNSAAMSRWSATLG